MCRRFKSAPAHCFKFLAVKYLRLAAFFACHRLKRVRAKCVPNRRLVIFTTTERLQGDLFRNFSSPFGSRCKIFDFKTKGLSKQFTAKIRRIAILEKLGNPSPQRSSPFLSMNSAFSQSRSPPTVALSKIAK